MNAEPSDEDAAHRAEVRKKRKGSIDEGMRWDGCVWGGVAQEEEREDLSQQLLWLPERG